MRPRALLTAPLIALLACTGATAPDSTAPDSTAPDSTAPHSTAPHSTAPATTLTRAPSSSVVGSASAAAPQWDDWYAYHRGPRRSGYAPSMPTPTTGLAIRRTIKLDGQVYASPLVIKGITIVATENNSVYAIDSRYRTLWKRHLGTPTNDSEHPCGNINPLGITGTPSYVASTNSVYVAAELSGNPPTHRVYSINFTTGAVRWSRSLDVAGVDRRVMQQRGALLTTSAGVFVPFGGLSGDCGDYKGRVIRYPLNGSGAPLVYTVPTTREAGIWTPPGPTYDGTNLFVAVGNGEATSGTWDGSDSVLKLSPSLRRLDYFAPSNWAEENRGDVDLGSQGPALVRDWIFQAGKSGRSYVLRRSSLGHIGGYVSSLASPSCHSFGGTAVAGYTLWVPCTEGVTAFSIDSGGQLHYRWRAASNVNGSPVAGGHRVWALDASGGRLYSLNPANGATVTSISVGTTSRFATPALYGHHVVVGTLTGLVVVGFG